MFHVILSDLLIRVLRRSLMRRSILAIAVCCLSATSVSVSAQYVGMPGMMYSGTIAGGCGGQLYPFDRQDPWLHGHIQRIPAYGGFSTFRPYNYRHVLAQTQIAANVWGAAHGQPYSQQFWNRYRADYLNGNVHSQALIHPTTPSAANPVSYQPQPSFDRSAPSATQSNVPAQSSQQPIHVYPHAIGADLGRGVTRGL
jgi:hypothetical protein